MITDHNLKVTPENYEGDLDFLRKAHHALLEVCGGVKIYFRNIKFLCSDWGDQRGPSLPWDVEKVPRHRRHPQHAAKWRRNLIFCHHWFSLIFFIVKVNLVLTCIFIISQVIFYREPHTEIQIEEKPLAPGTGTEAELRVIESTDTAWPSPEHKVQSLVIYWQAPLLVLGTQLHLEFRQFW